MKRTNPRTSVFGALFLCLAATVVFAAQDKYTLRVPNGLAFSDFRGYENWQVVAVSRRTRVAAKDYIFTGYPSR